MNFDNDLIVFFSDFAEVAEVLNNEFFVIFDSEYNEFESFGNLTSDVRTSCVVKNKDIIKYNITTDLIIKIRNIEYKIKNIEEDSNEISVLKLKRV